MGPVKGSHEGGFDDVRGLAGLWLHYDVSVYSFPVDTGCDSAIWEFGEFHVEERNGVVLLILSGEFGPRMDRVKTLVKCCSRV